MSGKQTYSGQYLEASIDWDIKPPTNSRVERIVQRQIDQRRDELIPILRDGRGAEVLLDQIIRPHFSATLHLPAGQSRDAIKLLTACIEDLQEQVIKQQDKPDLCLREMTEALRPNAIGLRHLAAIHVYSLARSAGGRFPASITPGSMEEGKAMAEWVMVCHEQPDAPSPFSHPENRSPAARAKHMLECLRMFVSVRCKSVDCDVDVKKVVKRYSATVSEGDGTSADQLREAIEAYQGSQGPSGREKIMAARHHYLDQLDNEHREQYLGAIHPYAFRRLRLESNVHHIEFSPGRLSP